MPSSPPHRPSRPSAPPASLAVPASLAASRRRLLLGAASTGILLGCGDPWRRSRGEGADLDRDPARPGSGEGGEGGSGGQGGGPGGEGGGASPSCDEPWAGGSLEGVLSFEGEGDPSFGELQGEGWDGRLYTDLATLTPETLITPNELFYVRTRYPDRLDPDAPWQIAIDGAVDDAVSIGLADLEPLVRPRGVHLLECSGNSVGGRFGLMSAAAWGGAAMPDVLALVRARPEATRVLVSGFDDHSVPSVNGHSKPGASWVFTFEQLAGAFLATEMNGAPLPPDHGAPVRLFVPGWYGCTCIKWVDRITLVGEGEPATAQMQEFASRTHQEGVPSLARDYRPASLDPAAMPVRVERWRVGGEVLLRVVGIVWGGARPTESLSIRFGDAAWSPVEVCPPATTSATWSLWSTAWRPPAPGAYPIRLRVDDPGVVTKRLDAGYYERTIVVDQA